MNQKKQAKMILAFAKALFVNGQTSKIVIDETTSLARALDIHAKILISWGEIILEVEDKNTGTQINLIEVAKPTNVHMGRVVNVMNLLKKVHEKQVTLEDAYVLLSELANLDPAPTWQFVAANGIGAVALGVIFGLNSWLGALLIFISACLGGLCRRYLSKISSNVFVQPFSSALIAGILGAILMYYYNSSYLVAVCPCMILIPGPHFLNGFLDLIRAQLELGFFRIIYAFLICFAVTAGLLMGLSLLGGSLPVTLNSTPLVPLTIDMLAAGLAVLSYCIFFSMPLNLILLPVSVGALAHILRWVTIIHFDFSLVSGTFLACFFVGVVLTWISHHKYLSFAAGGFSAVVSMMPGVFLFRMASGLVQLAQNNEVTFSLLTNTLYQGSMSIMIFFAIGMGLLVPRLLMDGFLKILG